MIYLLPFSDVIKVSCHQSMEEKILRKHVEFSVLIRNLLMQLRDLHTLKYDPEFVSDPTTTIYYHATTIYYQLLPSTTIYYHLLPSTTIYYHLLPSTTIYYHLLPSTTNYYQLLPTTTNYYHLLLYNKFQLYDRCLSHIN